MNMKLSISSLLGFISIAVAATACGKASDAKTEKIEGIEWNVSVNKVVEYDDSIFGMISDQIYNVADTARINAELMGVKHCGNISIGWTLPMADGSIWLVAYENEPLLSEKVPVTEANSLPSYDGNIQVAFKFSDAAKWATITRGNIGERLAVIVNGQLMNAPQVNTEITSGNCSVAIPQNMIGQFLPEEKVRLVMQESGDKNQIVR